MHNVFYVLSGVMGLVLLVLSLLRSATYSFDGVEYTILQYGLAFEGMYLFALGCLAEVVLYG